VSATQIVLAALVVIAFVLGWLARGRRERANRRSEPAEPSIAELDRRLGEALTAFQAVHGLWQLEGASISPLGRQALATFERHRTAARSLADCSGPGVPQLARALAALDSMAVGLEPYGEGIAPREEDQRRLIRDERSLASARHTLVLTAMVARPDRLD